MRTLGQQLRKARREDRARGSWWGGLSLVLGGAATWLAWRNGGGNAALATGLAAAGLWAAPLLAVAGMRMPERQRRWARRGDGDEAWRAAGESIGIALVRAQETPNLPQELAKELKDEAAALRTTLKSRRRGDIEAACFRVRKGALARHKEVLWTAARPFVLEAEQLLEAAEAKEGTGALDLELEVCGGVAAEVILLAMPGILQLDAWQGAQDCMLHALREGAERGLGMEQVARLSAALAVEWQDTSLPWEVFTETMGSALRRAGVASGAGRARVAAAGAEVAPEPAEVAPAPEAAGTEPGAAKGPAAAAAVVPEGAEPAAEALAGEEHVRIINGKRYRRVRVKQKSFHRRRHGHGGWGWMMLGPVVELGESFVRGLRMTWQRLRYGYRVWRMRQ